MFHSSKVFAVIGVLGMMVGGCAAEADADADDELGVAQSAIFTDTDRNNPTHRLEIKNESTGKCLDVARTLGARPTEAACTRSANQQFFLYQATWTSSQILLQGATHLCLGVTGTSAPDYTRVLVVPCRDAADKQAPGTLWRFTNPVDMAHPTASRMSFKLGSVPGPTSDGACLDVGMAYAPTAGTIYPTKAPSLRERIYTNEVRTMTCNGALNQHWIVTTF